MSEFASSILIALRAIRVNAMRSGLTMLGIIIGVAAVIAMVGVGAGATARIQQQIQSIGSNLIMVSPGSISSNGVRLGSGGVATLTEDDGKAIARECPSVAAVAPAVRGSVQVVSGNSNWATNAQGVTPDYMIIRDTAMLSGQFFTTQDVCCQSFSRSFSPPPSECSLATIRRAKLRIWTRSRRSATSKCTVA